VKLDHNGPAMESRVEIDPDLHAVAEWMQAHVPACKLVGIANALAASAPALWGQYQPETVQGLRLVVSGSIAEPRRPGASIG
jgi:hypothetical protein